MVHILLLLTFHLYFSTLLCVVGVQNANDEKGLLSLPMAFDLTGGLLKVSRYFFANDATTFLLNPRNRQPFTSKHKNLF